jgi:superfamily II helicase
MTEQNCRTCGHYELYKMITSGRPYGYSGDIPCLRCNRFRVSNDEHTASDMSQNASAIWWRSGWR